MRARYRTPICAGMLGVFGALASLLAAASVSAHLAPEQIAVLANANDAGSLAVARHYVERRGIAVDHIIELDVPSVETVSRETYDTAIVQPTRRLLQARGLASKIRALVTTYGVPLRVEAPSLNEQRKRWLADTTARTRQTLARLRLVNERLRAMAGMPALERFPEAPARAIEQVATTLREAAKRLSGTPHTPAASRADEAELTRLTARFGGLAVLVQNLPPASTEQARAEQDILRREVSAAQTMVQLLNQLPSDQNRRRAYRLTEQMFGLQGVLILAQADTDILSYRDGDASVDSELSLLWRDPDSYYLSGRLSNPFHEAAQVGQGSLLPLLMVSRLDAPTPDLAKELVDRALLAEQNGLTGTIYLDAQGLTGGPAPSYGSYDQALRDLADLLRRSTAYSVVLDNTGQRFSHPGDAPDTAVYVGWYRLRAYEDAFSFRPGAIGYHMASEEAVSIHDRNETGWCKNALERGITVTLGSVNEPLLDAFPEPSRFIGLLLTGRYSLVEAYYLTSRYVSWRMILFGDPLYRPWRGRDAGPLPEPLPIAPSAQPFTDPIESLAQVKRLRETALAQVDRALARLDAGPEPSQP